jgi:hypothetical protein
VWELSQVVELLLGQMVTDAVQLSFPTEPIESGIVVLMSIHVGVVQCESEILTADKYIF